MNWKIDKGRPICPQVFEQICVYIASGKILPDEKLKSVRETAVEAGINPNTAQKSFELLEQSGIVYSVRGSGWYVSENTDKAKEILNEIIKEKTKSYFSEMSDLGISAENVRKYIEEFKL